MTEFVKQCLHCTDSKAGEEVPRLGQVLHFDYLYVGDSGPLGKNG